MIVSMPDLEDVVLPSSGGGYGNNPGLKEALRADSYPSSILDEIDQLMAGLETYGSTYMPEFVTSASIVDVGGTSLSPSDFQAGRVHRLVGALPSSGGGGGKGKGKGKSGGSGGGGSAGSGDASCGNMVRLERGTYRNLVILADCKVTFQGGAILEDVVVANVDAGRDSFTGSSGVKLGRADDCASGGGAKLITKGGMRFPSGLVLNGAQLIAQGDVQFAASGDGMNGAAIVAGGEIDGTSRTTMTGCEVDDAYSVPSVRMAY